MLRATRLIGAAFFSRLSAYRSPSSAPPSQQDRENDAMWRQQLQRPPRAQHFGVDYDNEAFSYKRNRPLPSAEKDDSGGIAGGEGGGTPSTHSSLSSSPSREELERQRAENRIRQAQRGANFSHMFDDIADSKFSGDGATQEEPLAPLSLPPLKSFQFEQQEREREERGGMYDEDNFRHIQQQQNQQQHRREEDHRADDDDPVISLLRVFTGSLGDGGGGVTNETVAQLARTIVDEMDLAKKELAVSDGRDDENDNCVLLAVRRAARISSLRPVRYCNQEIDGEEDEDGGYDSDAAAASAAAGGGGWVGALGLFSALRVVPFVSHSQNSSSSSSSAYEPFYSSVSSSELARLQSAQIASALALSQSLLQPRRERRGNNSNASGSRDRKNNTHHQLEVSAIEAIVNCVVETDVFRAGSSDGETQQQTTTTSLAAISHSSALTTNFIVSAGLRALEKKRNGDSDINSVVEAVTSSSWQAALRLTQLLIVDEKLLAFSSPSVDRSSSSSSNSSSGSGAIPLPVVNAIPFAYSSCARVLRKFGKTEEAMTILSEFLKLRHATLAAVKDAGERRNSSSASSSSSWFDCPAPLHAWCRLMASEAPLHILSSSSSSSSSPLTVALDLILTKQQQGKQGKQLEQEGREASNDDNEHAIAVSFVPNVGSHATFLAVLKTIMWRSLSSSSSSPPLLALPFDVFDCLSLQLDALDALADSAAANFSEIIESFAQILSVCDLFSASATSSLSEEESSYATPFDATVTGRFVEKLHLLNEQQLHHQPHSQLVLSHPLVIAALMQSAIRQRRLDVALDLFLRFGTEEKLLSVLQQQHQEEEEDFEEKSLEADRRINSDAVDGLAQYLTHRFFLKDSSSSSSYSKSVVLSLFQHSIGASVAAELRQHHRRGGRRHHHQSRTTLSLFAPSLFERGLNEITCAYLEAMIQKATTNSTTEESSATLVKDDCVRQVLSQLPPAAWRFEFMPRLLKLLSVCGAQHKVSVVYHAARDECAKFYAATVDEEALRGIAAVVTSPDQANQRRDREGEETQRVTVNNDNNYDDATNNNDNNNASHAILDPAQVDFESWQSMQQHHFSTRGQKRLRRRQQDLQRQHEEQELRRNIFFSPYEIRRREERRQQQGKRRGSDRAMQQHLLPLPFFDELALECCSQSFADAGKFDLAAVAANELASCVKFSELKNKNLSTEEAEEKLTPSLRRDFAMSGSVSLVKKSADDLDKEQQRRWALKERIAKGLKK